MKALFALLDRVKPEQRMLRAEIARELGRFPEALALLNFDFGDRFRGYGERNSRIGKSKQSGRRASAERIKKKTDKSASE